MKRTYSFFSKTMVVLVCVALAMGLALCLLGVTYAQTRPDAQDVPYAFRYEQDILLSAAAFMGLCLLGGLAYLLHAAGRRPGNTGFEPGWQEAIPLDIYLLSFGFLTILGISLVFELRDGMDFNLYTLMIVGVPVSVVIALFSIGLLTTLAVRLKLGGWWRNTVCYWVLRLLWKGGKWAWNLCKRRLLNLNELFVNLPTIWPVALCSGTFLLVAFFLGGAKMYSSLELFLWFVVCAGIFLCCCYGALQFGTIQRVSQRLAAGDLEAKMEIKHMLPIFRRHAEAINSIGAGMTTTVEARLKSERFKTELITNVSHDLKTPLTSIINYVDLLGKERLENEKAKQYIQVLSRQAQRLKKLTEDLIEASKASTGNIAVERVRTDVAELLNQCSAEYVERMQAAELTMLCDAEKGLFAMADGRLLWRVFDNLLGNACKYAQSGTRVYLTAREQEGRAHIEIKNISREVLNISPEELMERFVRGDSSRPADGSGLGLSIAQSLAQLNGGSLTLYVDGDLFKAIVELELA